MISDAGVTPPWMSTVTMRVAESNAAVAVPFLIPPASTTLTVTPVSEPPRRRSLARIRSLFEPGSRSEATAATPSTPPLETSSAGAMVEAFTAPTPVFATE